MRSFARRWRAAFTARSSQSGPQFYTTLGTEMDNIINGMKTVDQGLADAQAQLEELMAG